MLPVDEVDLLEPLAPDRQITPIGFPPQTLTQEHKQPVALALVL